MCTVDENVKFSDIMRMYFDIDEQGVIRGIKFKTFECGVVATTSGMATELIKRETVQEVLDRLHSIMIEELERVSE